MDWLRLTGGHAAILKCEVPFGWGRNRQERRPGKWPRDTQGTVKEQAGNTKKRKNFPITLR